MCRYDIITAILVFIEPLLNPNHWFRVGITNFEWDKRIRKAMATEEVSNIVGCKCMIGEEEVWTGNYPYSYGGRYDDSYKLPRRSTVVRLHRMTEKHNLK